MDKSAVEDLHAKNIKFEKERIKKSEKSSRKRRNVSLVMLVFFILVVSSLNMLSANFYDIYENGFRRVWYHIFYMVIGICMCIYFTFFTDYRKFNKNRRVGFLFLGSIFTFLFVIIVGKYLGPHFSFCAKIVPKVNGAIGWIKILKWSIQPAEILKIPYIIVLAHVMEAVERNKYDDKKKIVFLGSILVIYMGLIIWQEDLGTSLHYLSIFVFMFFMTDFSMKKIIGMASLLGVTMGGFFYYIYSLENAGEKGYKFGRVESFLDGLIHNEYDNLYGYQVKQSLFAFGSGGIKGKGYANGVQKFKYLPEVRTDFILASFGEEFGFIGMAILLFAFFMIFSIIKRIAMNTKDYFGKYLAIGISGYIITQVLINVCVALGLLPVFGIPMPLFSYGGSSMITVLTGIGIALNINNKGYK